MPIKAVLDSLEGIDASLHGLYREAEDGRFYLDAEGVDELPQVRGLASTLKKYKEAAPSAHGLKQKLERLAELEAFAALEMTADEVRERLQELEELKASGAKANSEQVEKLRETYEKRVAATKKQLEEQIAAKEAEIQRLNAFVERLTIDNEIEAALAKVNVIPETREAVKALLKLRGPKVVHDGESYRGVFETDLGEIPIKDYVEAWSRKDEAAPFLPASGNKGSGATSGKAGGSARVNPFRAETRNLTEQMRLMKENPTLARQLAAEAGIKLPIQAA